MFQTFIAMSLLLMGSISLARTSCYFQTNGKAVILDIQSGKAFTPDPRDSDDDAIRLFDAMNVPAEDSIRGKEKQIAIENALTWLVANDGHGEYDGLMAIDKSEGVEIDNEANILNIRWRGSKATFMFERLHHQEGHFNFTSADGRLKIYSDKNQFTLSYN